MTTLRPSERLRQQKAAGVSAADRVGALGALVRFFYGFLRGLAWAYQHTLRPVMRPVWRGARWAFLQYRRLWDRVVYLRSGAFSKARAGGMVLMTAGVVYFSLPILGFFRDAGIFALTYGHEDIYLTFSQEIDPAHNLHSVKGCEDLPCTESNSVYFRVREDAFNSFWSLLRHGDLFYPDYVAAAVPAVVSKCHVTRYGLRKKFAMRNWDIYPDMLEAHCSPCGSGGIDQCKPGEPLQTPKNSLNPLVNG